MTTKLATYLEEHDLSQAAFGRLVGVEQAMISQWASAKRRPGSAYAKAIDEATGGAVPRDYWLDIKAENKNGRQRKRPKRVSRKAE